jgi:hypothetical protein
VAYFLNLADAKTVNTMKSENNNLFVKLMECVLACNECHDACLREKDVMMMAECIRLDKDCAVVCASTLQLIHSGSRVMKQALALCVSSCEMCAEECSKHNFDHCRKCAEVCRECAKACRELSAGL